MLTFKSLGHPVKLNLQFGWNENVFFLFQIFAEVIIIRAQTAKMLKLPRAFASVLHIVREKFRGKNILVKICYFSRNADKLLPYEIN